MIDFRMPSLGADMAAGTLVEWLVKPGDHVRRGDVVAVVETQKGAIEIEIFNTGTMSELVVPVGNSVPVGTVLARLEGAEAMPAQAVTPPREAAPAPTPTPAGVSVPTPLAAGSRQRVSPAARRLAAERGIKEGDLVKLFNDRGGVVVVARLTERVPRFVIHSYCSSGLYAPYDHGNPDSIDRGGCVNILTPKRPQSAKVAGFAPNSCLVDVVKWEGE